MDAELPSALLRVNLAGSLAILAVMLLRQGFRRWFGAGGAYGLWLVPPIAAMASLIPGPRWTIPLVDTLPALAQPVAAAPDAVAAPPSWPLIVLAIWIAGVLVTGAIIAIRQRRFMVALGRPELDADGLPILRARDGFAVGPAVIGTFAPRIVLPADFEQRYSADERRVILAHERVHLFGYDAQANAVAALLQCLCWFNPLVHMAAHFFRVDQELNADAQVVRQFPDQQKTYAEALLKTQIASRSLILGCQWPARSEHPLKRRIALLPLRAPGLTRRFGAGALAALVVLGGVAAWAGSPRLSLGGGPGGALTIWAVLKPLDRHEPRRLHARLGAWTDMTIDVDSGERYRVSLNPHTLASNVVEVRVRVEAAGAITEPAPLLLDSAEPGIIRLGHSVLLITVARDGE